LDFAARLRTHDYFALRGDARDRRSFVARALEIGMRRTASAPSRLVQISLLVLDGHFSIQVPVRVSSRAAAGKTVLEGKLHYQACDHEHCLFPRTLPVEIPLRIER